MQAIKDGVIDGTIVQNPSGQGYLGMMLLQYLSEGYKPKADVYFVDAGFAYANQDNAIAAESAYRLASLLDPKAMDWKMGLARSFFKQQRYADAVALSSTMLAANPERADLWLLRA